MPDGLSVLDYVLLGALALGVWRGLRTGAIGQIVGTLGLVLAFWAGTLLMQPVGEAASASLGLSERVAPVVGFVVTFTAVLAVLASASHLLRSALAALRLGFVDKAAGALFGGLRAALLLSVMLLVLGATPRPLAGVLLGDAPAESVLLGPLRALAPAAWELLGQAAPSLEERLHLGEPEA